MSKKEISCKEDFRKIRYNPNGDFYITKDINLNKKDENRLSSIIKKFLGIGNFKTIEYFNGTLDGQGHKIKGLSINNTGDREVAFIKNIEKGAVIENLHFREAEIIGGKKIAGIAINNDGKIINCSFHGSIKHEKKVPKWGEALAAGATSLNDIKRRSPTSYIGGICSKNWETGEIIKCEFNGDINGEEKVGGIVGENFNLIKKCSSHGEIKGDSKVGGIASESSNRPGESCPRISLCDSDSIVEGKTEVGGIAGWNGGKINLSYYTGDISAEDEINSGILAGRNNNKVKNCYWVGDMFLTPTGPSSDFKSEKEEKNNERKESVEEIEKEIVKNSI